MRVAKKKNPFKTKSINKYNQNTKNMCVQNSKAYYEINIKTKTQSILNNEHNPVI